MQEAIAAAQELEKPRPVALDYTNEQRSVAAGPTHESSPEDSSEPAYEPEAQQSR